MSDFIPYWKARKLLESRLGATAEEIAAWVYFAPPSRSRPKMESRLAELAQSPAWAGLAAYSDAGEFDEPPRFFFDWELHGDDYLKPLAACWFNTQEIAEFQPKDRYITAGALLERWRPALGDDVEAVIETCIKQSRLHDIHPTRVVTQWSPPDAPAKESPDAPAKESALFSLTEVVTIEREDEIESRAIDGHLAPEQAENEAQEESAGTDRDALMARHKELIDTNCKSPTATLAKEFGISESRVRAIKRQVNKKPRTGMGAMAQQLTKSRVHKIGK